MKINSRLIYFDSRTGELLRYLKTICSISCLWKWEKVRRAEDAHQKYVVLRELHGLYTRQNKRVLTQIDTLLHPIHNLD